MSYRIRFTLPDGRTGLWAHEYQTRETAQAAIDDRLADTGFAYAVEEVHGAPTWNEEAPRWMREMPSDTIMKIDDVFLRAFAADTVDAPKLVEEVPGAPEPGSTAAHHVEILRARVKELEEVQKAMQRDIAFAIQLGDAMRDAMRTGEWRAGHDRSMANSAVAGWDRWRTGLAKAPACP